MKYRAEIDGLRAVAVVPVILFHAGVAGFGGGFVGVDVFFVISGYLITDILVRELDEGCFSLWSFYERRARRILPPLVLVVLCCLPAAWVLLLPADMTSFAHSLVAVATFSSNILFWQESGYFDTATDLKPLLHTWSLAVEEQFYIFFPLLLMLLRQRWRRSLVPVLGALCLASLGLAQWGAYAKPDATFYLLPTRGWELLIGAFAALYLRNKTLTPMPIIGDALSVAGLGAIGLAIFAYGAQTPFPSLYALVPTLGTVLIILFAAPGTLVHRLLTRRWIVGIGLISYSAYLWHQPLIAFYLQRFPAASEFLPAVAALAFPLAYLSWRHVETPFRKRKPGADRRAVFGVAAGVLATTACAGIVLGLRDGMMQRYSPQVQQVIAQFNMGPAYVPPRFNALQLAPFDETGGKARVLIIGDSYGRDVVNALYETDQHKLIDLSTYFISARCGNILIDEDLSRYRDPADRHVCSKQAGYGDPDLHIRIKQADEIWLISSWKDWSSALIPRSLPNLRAMTKARIVVFGRKHIGSRKLGDYNAGGLMALLGEGPVPEDMAQIAVWMAEHIPAQADFVDLQQILCGDYFTCVNDTGAGLPITFDGTHMTPAGARFLGEGLRDFMGGHRTFAARP